MKVLFDNNISPLVAPVLDAWLRSDGDAAVHIKDMPCGRNAADEEWIALLAASPDDEWVVFTCDKRLHRNAAERAAYRRAHLFGFVLAPSFRKMPANQVAALLVHRWPALKLYARQTARPALVEIQRKPDRFKQMPW